MSRLPLGQLFMFGFDGTEVTADVKDLVKEQGAGGVILFKRNIVDLEQVVALNAGLTTLGIDAAGEDGLPLMIGVDQEGGRVARMRGICTDLPPMQTLGHAAKTEPELAYRVGAMMARELVATGFHLDFAPVVDVDTNPENPVIGERAFARDADAVAAVTADFIRGMQDAGMAASAKHFPGHGDTAQDSHVDLPVLNHDLDRLKAVELVPFKRAVDVGVATIMTAHVLFPALDADHPATLSEAILGALLRDALGYDGVIVSDDLEMKAVADRYSVREMVKLGLNAGVDLFLVCRDVEKTAEAIWAAHELVDTGEVPESRVRQALARIEALKRTYVGAPAVPSLSSARQIVQSAPHKALADRLTRYAEGATRARQRPASLVDETH